MKNNMQDLVCEMCNEPGLNGHLNKGNFICNMCCPVYKEISCFNLVKNQNYELCNTCRYCTLVVDANKQYCVNKSCTSYV